MLLIFLSLSCSTASVTENEEVPAEENRHLSWKVTALKGLPVMNTRVYITTWKQEIIWPQKFWWVLKISITNLSTHRQCESKKLHRSQRGLTEAHVPENRKSELSKSSTLPIFTYQALYKFNNLTWHLRTPPKTTGHAVSNSGRGDFVRSKIYHQFLFVTLLTHHQHLLQRENMSWLWERAHT